MLRDRKRQNNVFLVVSIDAELFPNVCQLLKASCDYALLRYLSVNFI